MSKPFVETSWNVVFSKEECNGESLDDFRVLWKRQKIVVEQKLTTKQIWNCDESGFPTDPGKCKVVSVRGEKAYKVTQGQGRENITTLTTCSAAGQVLDPMIVFASKNLQTTWKGDKALPNTWYSILDSGWMTRGVPWLV